MKKQKVCFVVLNILFPLLIGAVLYYLMSPNTIFVKLINQIIEREIHNLIIPLQNKFLRFIRFYFLDMCWAYALIFSLYVTLGNNAANLKKTFLIAFVFSAVMEFLQLTPLVEGTFDVLDVLCESLAEGIAVFVINYAQEEAML